ncbi:uncharacterized protein LACBIDRAFT_302394 [Laccaria bicolor S238N-H82]|uniref:Predicted protein n=1 Tax=Laccaria bicolor (strain S238N-H82 / ATCC MYA-4686) TaxID=486041 RepID=B0E427_LACBS|nr:uncharacterized protein LACBIDRAFT_302394 [Laccaria bicolor S238N-H82]EDQ98405.1 predicted protein [Laccaria bicolor S238N-H82]|eukprot:XP_001890945.1 predicted protein [Laccaria bicolor S238N-H82]
MKYPLKAHRFNYEKVLWSLPTFYEKNIAFMKKKDTGHTYESPFIKLVDLYTQLYRQVP